MIAGLGGQSSDMHDKTMGQAASSLLKPYSMISMKWNLDFLKTDAIIERPT
jgi:hypothetical protein